MRVRGVVPERGQVVWIPVEDDPASHENEPRDDVLDGAELVRDVEDRDAELVAEPGEERRERFLRLGVDAGRRLVEREEGWARRRVRAR